MKRSLLVILLIMAIVWFASVHPARVQNRPDLGPLKEQLRTASRVHHGPRKGVLEARDEARRAIAEVRGELAESLGEVNQELHGALQEAVQEIREAVDGIP